MLLFFPPLLSVSVPATVSGSLICLCYDCVNFPLPECSIAVFGPVKFLQVTSCLVFHLLPFISRYDKPHTGQGMCYFIQWKLSLGSLHITASSGGWMSSDPPKYCCQITYLWDPHPQLCDTESVVSIVCVAQQH